MGISTTQYEQMLWRLNRNPLRESPRIESVERERQLHDQIISECSRRGWLVVHSRMDRPSTIQVGAPDFMVIADQGRTFLVECKGRDGKLTPAQTAWLAWAQKLGHRAAVIRNISEFMELVAPKSEDREREPL